LSAFPTPAHPHDCGADGLGDRGGRAPEKPGLLEASVNEVTEARRTL
jgi:hypothetical protein